MQGMETVSKREGQGARASGALSYISGALSISSSFSECMQFPSFVTNVSDVPRSPPGS